MKFFYLSSQNTEFPQYPFNSHGSINVPQTVKTLFRAFVQSTRDEIMKSAVL